MSTSAREAKKRKLHIVVSSDFNTWRGLKNPSKRRASSEVLVRMRNELNLVNAYNLLSGEESGSKTCMTHHFRFKQYSPSHIDYCFASKEWLHPLVDV